MAEPLQGRRLGVQAVHRREIGPDGRVGLAKVGGLLSREQFAEDLERSIESAQCPTLASWKLLASSGKLPAPRPVQSATFR